MFKQCGLLSGWMMLGLLTGCGSSDNIPGSSTNASETKHLRFVSVGPELPTPAPGEATWPCWRGPQKNGISLETEWQTDWSTPPQIAWKKDIGLGHGNVSVVGNKLMAMGHPYATDTETVWCLDPDTGQEIWSITYPCALLDHLYKGGPAATPTIDGGFVYTNSREGEVRKLNLETGELVWLFNIRKELGINLPELGFTGSPVVYRDQVLMEAGSVFGINKETGELLWKTVSRSPGYGTPEVFEYAGQPYVAALNNEGLVVVDLTTHQEVAFASWDSPFNTNSTSPIWHEGQLFVSTGYNIGCAVFDFDGDSLQQEWRNKSLRNHRDSSLLQHGYLYGVDGNPHLRRTVTLKCVDWETGEIQWSQGGIGCGAIAAANGHLLVLSDDGELILAEMNPQAFEELGRIRVMDEQCWTAPVLCNGRIYCRGTDGTLACIDVSQP